MSFLSRYGLVVIVGTASAACVSIASFGLVYKLLKIGVGTGEMARVMTKATFYPTLLYNVWMEKVSSRRWFDRIDETVILGAIPFRSDLPKLAENKVKRVITLNEDFELRFSRWWTVQPEEWAVIGIRHLHLRVVDLVAAPSVEQTRQGVQFIQEAKANGESVYVHCKAGRTRSSTVVAAYLIEDAGLSPTEAVDHLKAIRSHVSVRRPQRLLLDRYYEDFLKRKDEPTVEEEQEGEEEE